MVEVTSGKLVGKSVEFSLRDVDVKRTVHVFKGIPYAEPPVGDLRFRPPETKVPWEGVYDATEFKSTCSQPVMAMIPTDEPKSEDCLFLNIYVPQTNVSTHTLHRTV